MVCQRVTSQKFIDRLALASLERTAPEVPKIIIAYLLIQAADANQCKAAQNLIYLQEYQGLSCEFPLQTTLKKAADVPSLAAFAICARYHLEDVRCRGQLTHIDGANNGTNSTLVVCATVHLNRANQSLRELETLENERVKRLF